MFVKQTFKCIVFLNFLFNGIAEEGATKCLPLGKHKPNLGPIKILNYEPTPEEFYHKFVWSSTPVLIRTKNPSWKAFLSSLINSEWARKHYGNTYGRAYKRPVWTIDWPLEIRLSYKEFLERVPTEKLYWDSQLPLNNALLKHIPLPLFLQNLPYHDWISESTLLHTNQNASSVFHHDGAENFLFQISGRKTWLLAEPSFALQAYANSYTTQAGLSPINPEKVDLNKFPLISEIDFYEITTEPGDMIYVPEYWWHQVRSHDPPVVALNIWSEIFSSESVENEYDVIQYTEKFAEFRQLEPPIVSCNWQHTNLEEVEENNYEDLFFSSTGQNYEGGFMLYFGSDEGAFYAVNSDNGKVVWKYSIKQDTGSTPVVSKNNKVVYFAGEDAEIYAFAVKSGNLLWKTTVSDGVAGALRLNSDGTTLYVVSINGHVYAINATTGMFLWQQDIVNGEIWSSPYIFRDNSIIICLWTDGEIKMSNQAQVFSFDLTSGEENWRYATGNAVFSTPCVDTLNNLIYILDIAGKIHVLNIETGVLSQMFDIGSSCESSPIVSPKFDKLYVTTSSGKMKRMDINTGTADWEKEINSNEEENVMSSPLLSPKLNTLYAAAGHVVNALDSETGQILWEYSANGTFISSPRIDKNGALYIGGTDGMLYVLNSADGTLLWQLLTGGPIVSSVAFHDDFISKDEVGGLL